MEEAREALQRYFGHGDFRHPQDKIVASILSGKNTLVIMPTGGGKSLCYQLPALLLEGVTLVISPLIALMKDQVDALKARGIAAAMINSSQGWPEQQEVLDQMGKGELKLVYIAPERFRAGSFLRSLKNTRIAHVAVDEAHCISQWGHDFRPDYFRLGEVLESLGSPQCSAFTATATPDVRADIQERLHLHEADVYVSGFARPNLSFNIRSLKKKVEKQSRLRKLIEKHRTGIIYCATRKTVEEVSEGLGMDSIPHAIYHAGLSKEARDAAQDRFLRGESNVVVATNAFGMGIDRADIRFVCHYEMPGSVEAFYQEAGRAGRDGDPAYCEMLFMHSDRRVQEFFLEGSNPEVETIRKVYGTVQERANERHELVLSVDNIAEAMAERTNRMAVQTALTHLVRHGYLERFDVPGERARGTRLKQPRVFPHQLELPEADLMEKKARDEARLNTVIQMAYAKGCRQGWILQYFGAEKAEPCGRCDTCGSGKEVRELSEEENVIVRKALSGVARLSDRVNRYVWKPRVGKGRVIQCLRGEKKQKILDAGQDRLSTFGVLEDCAPEFLHELFDSLVGAGLVVQPQDGQYPLMGISELGARVMYGEEMVPLHWPEMRSAQKPPKNGKAAAEAVEDKSLYQRLVTLRNEMRIEQKVPAYRIFPNTVLAELADQKPGSVEEAMDIRGVGPAKAESILPPFLELIASEG